MQLTWNAPDSTLYYLGSGAGVGTTVAVDLPSEKVDYQLDGSGAAPAAISASGDRLVKMTSFDWRILPVPTPDGDYGQTIGGIFPDQVYGVASLSPDDRTVYLTQLAMSDTTELWAVSTVGEGQNRLIATLRGTQYLSGLETRSDGRLLISHFRFPGDGTSVESTTLTVLDPTTGLIELTFPMSPGAKLVDIDLSGRYLLATVPDGDNEPTIAWIDACTWQSGPLATGSDAAW